MRNCTVSKSTEPREQRGSSMLEYSLLVSLIVASSIMAIRVIPHVVNKHICAYHNMGNAMPAMYDPNTGHCYDINQPDPEFNPPFF